MSSRAAPSNTITVNARKSLQAGGPSQVDCIINASQSSTVRVDGAWTGDRDVQPSAGSPAWDRLLQAVSTAGSNGFPIDGDVLRRGMDLGWRLAAEHSPFAHRTDVNLGPSGSLEFVVSLPGAVVEIFADRDRLGFDVLVEYRAGAASEEVRCLDATKVIDFLAASIAP